MKKSNPSGFAAIEAILVCVILGIIGFTGYFVWSAKQNTDSSLNNSSNSNQAVVKTNKTVTDKAAPMNYDITNWAEAFIATEARLRIPDGWSVDNIDGSQLAASGSKSVTYKPGTKAIVTKVAGGSDGDFRFVAIVDRPNRDLSNYQKVGDFTATGLSGSKYSMIVKNAGEGSGPTNGTKEYLYYIMLDEGNYITLIYDIYPGDADQVSLVDAAVKTLQRAGE